jgi:hypothetical protein
MKIGKNIENCYLKQELIVTKLAEMSSSNKYAIN